MSAYQTEPKVTTRRRRSNGDLPAAQQPAVAPAVSARFEVQPQPATGPGVRIMATLAGGDDVELTRTVVAAVAYALWQHRGADHLTNWVDAEQIVGELFGVERPKLRRASSSGRAGRSATALKLPGIHDDVDLLPAIMPRSVRTRRL
jgi:hypothetical protein